MQHWQLKGWMTLKIDAAALKREHVSRKHVITHTYIFDLNEENYPSGAYYTWRGNPGAHKMAFELKYLTCWEILFLTFLGWMKRLTPPDSCMRHKSLIVLHSYQIEHVNRRDLDSFKWDVLMSSSVNPPPTESIAPPVWKGWLQNDYKQACHVVSISCICCVSTFSYQDSFWSSSSVISSLLILVVSLGSYFIYLSFNRVLWPSDEQH